MYGDTMNDNSGIYNSFGQFFGSSFQFGQTDPDCFRFNSVPYVTNIYGEIGNSPFQTPQLDSSSTLLRITETAESNVEGFVSTPMMFQSMGTILDSFPFNQSPEHPEHSTPIQPMEPVYKDVNQGLVGGVTQVVPYTIPNEPAQSFDTPMTQPETSSERATETRCVPEATPSFVPLNFRNSSFLAMQNSYDTSLEAKDLSFPQIPQWSGIEMNDTGEAHQTLTSKVSELLTRNGIEIPEKIAWIRSIESPNPCFASAREAMILDWLLENHPDLFLLIPESLLSPNFRRKQSEMICQIFVDEVFAYAETTAL